MNQNLKSLLLCPACREPDLSYDAKAISCQSCGQEYPVVGGVPHFSLNRESSQVRDAFGQQWRFRREELFEKEDRLFWLEHEHSVDYLCQAPPEGIPTTGWLLDAGCGSGEKSIALARRFPELQVVAFDLYDGLWHLLEQAPPNLHVIQGDISHPPFRQSSFNIVVAIGSLHHTPDTFQAFQRAARLVKPQGQLVTYLYPAADESEAYQKLYYWIRDILFLGKGHLLSPARRLFFVKVLAGLLMPFLTVLHLTGWHRELYGNLGLGELYRGLVFMMHDNIAPEFQWRHSKHEVESWYAEDGFECQSPDPGFYKGVLSSRQPEE